MTWNAERTRLSMQYTYVKKTWDLIPTHFIIWESWDFVRVNTIDTIVGATLSGEANRNGVHIEIVGNFDKNKPNKSQRKTLNMIIWRVKDKHQDMEVKYHRDFQNKSCPGLLFDINDMEEWIKEPVPLIKYTKKNWQSLGKFLVTSYHPCVWNSINDDAISGGSCHVTASGMPLKDEYAWKVVACPPEFNIWKNWTGREKLEIVGYGIVECVDRWWAINWKHLDLFVGMWDFWKDNRVKNVYGWALWYREIRYVE